MNLKSFSSRRVGKGGGRRIIGLLLVLGMGGILLALAALLIAKWNAPTPIARILPANETLFFFQLHTDPDSRDYRQLQQIYAARGQTPLDFFELDDIGLADLNGLAQHFGSRVGVAFLGQKFDHNKWLLIVEPDSISAAREYLASLALPGESLSEQNFLGNEIYSFPQSHQLVFTFLGDDLLLSPDLLTLQSVLGSNARVAETTSYQALSDRLDPRSLGFGFASDKFLQQVFSAQLGGLPRVTLTPLLELFIAGGLAIDATAQGVRVSLELVLPDELARQEIFAELPPLTPKLLGLLGPETISLFTSFDLANQAQHFLTASEPNFSLLASGVLDRLTRDLLGQSTSFAGELAPLLSETVLIGQTSTGRFAILSGAQVARHWPVVVDKLQFAAGIFSAKQQTFILPDGTTGAQSVATPESIVETQSSHAGVEYQVLTAPNRHLAYALFGGTLLLATDSATLEILLDRLAVGETTDLVDRLAELDRPVDGVFYDQLGGDSALFLQPFDYVISGYRARARSVRFDILLKQIDDH